MRQHPFTEQILNPSPAQVVGDADILNQQRIQDGLAQAAAILTTQLQAADLLTTVGPVASFGTVATGPFLAPATITFDGSASSAPGDNISAYIWSFGDGTTVPAGSRVSHTYNAGGNYLVSLTIRTELGHSANQSMPL